MSIIVMFGCVPPATDSPSADTDVYANLEDCEPCPLLLNFASSPIIKIGIGGEQLIITINYSNAIVEKLILKIHLSIWLILISN